MSQMSRNSPTYGATTTRKSEHATCKQIIDCASLRLCSDCQESKVHSFGALRRPAGLCYVLQLSVEAVCYVCFVLQLFGGGCVSCCSFLLRPCNTVFRVTAF